MKKKNTSPKKNSISFKNKPSFASKRLKVPISKGSSESLKDFSLNKKKEFSKKKSEAFKNKPSFVPKGLEFPISKGSSESLKDFSLNKKKEFSKKKSETFKKKPPFASKGLEFPDSKHLSRSTKEISLEKKNKFLKRESKPNDKNASFVSKKPKKNASKNFSEISEDIRLNKYLANAGVGSRREADELIQTGRVSLNGQIVRTLGLKIKSTDKVTFDEKKIKAQPKQYLLLNKPKGFITTSKDERDRKTVMDLIEGGVSNRIYPVGRLDRQTTGVLLLSNDGDLTKKLTHPSHKVEKIYHVKLDRKLESSDFEKIKEGVFLSEGKLRVDKINYIEGVPKSEVGIELHIGWNRVIRRLFKLLNYEIISLDRVSFAGLTKKRLKRGQWRALTPEEIQFLKMR